MKRLYYSKKIILFAMIFYIFSCTKYYNNKSAGVILTFDDHYIDEWYNAYNDVFKKYNAKATFFVNKFHLLTNEQIEKLKKLEEGENEIACHGYNHLNAVEYCKNHTVNEYIENEIIPAINDMKEYGFDPKSFAHPYGANDYKIDKKLLNYFNILRDTAHDNIAESPQSYFFDPSNPKSIVAGFELDLLYGFSDSEIIGLLEIAKQNDIIVVLYGHSTKDDINVNPNQKYVVSYSRLKKICEFVNNNNMKFYTICELK